MKFVILVCALLCGCSTVCKVEETRCNKNVAEVCDANGQWQKIMSCDEVEGGDEPWSCCESSTDAGPISACLPASMCIGGDQ